jgi:farnesyl-diphosphate farnesyltransferase
MMRLAVSFGQGLQMTNILKDQWEDRSQGACWLPQDIFAEHGVCLAELHAGQQDANYAEASNEIIGIAHSHLRRALDYTLLIPATHPGLRRFCLWSVGLAVLTLRNLHDNLDFSSGNQIKVSHNAVAGVILLTKLTSKHNSSLRWIFTMAARQLPLTPLAAEWSEPAHSSLAWPKSGIPYLAETAWYEHEDAKDAQLR